MTARPSRRFTAIPWVLGVAMTMVAASEASAQSGSRPASPPQGSGQRAPAAGSGTATRAPSQPAQAMALSGYSPVPLRTSGAWSKGNPSLAATFDGKTYAFANDSERQAFAADPILYVPVLGGDCVVAYAMHGQRVPGSVQHASKHGGRLFLFSSADARKMFEANPASFENADLAYGGNCVVCAVGMGQSMPGRPEFTTVHKGLRYLFPSPDQQQEFMANPAKYEATGASRPQAAAPAGPGGSATRPAAPPAGSGSGTR